MRSWALIVLLALASGPVIAQENVVTGTGALLRGLDKVDGDVVDMSVAIGESAQIGRLSVELRDCRYPQASVSEAYAFLTIQDTATKDVIFNGWMMASSPALNALEHPRYDVWVLGCNTE